MAAPRIEIKGDASGVKRAAKDAEQAVSRMNRHVEESNRRFSGMGGAAKMAAVGGVAVLAAGVTKFGVDSVKAAGEAEAAMALVRKEMDQSGLSWEKYGTQVEKAAQASAKKGFDDEEAAKSIADLARVTGDVTKAVELHGVAMDIARNKGVSLDAATQMLSKAQLGNVRVAKTLGVEVEKGAKAQDVLAAIQKKYAGQADAYAKTQAGATDRMKVAWGNLQEQVGQKLMPVLTRLFTRLAEWLDWLGKNWPQIWARVKSAVQPVMDFLRQYIPRVIAVWKNAFLVIVNFLRGDWPAAWGNLKQVVSNALGGLKVLAGVALKAGLALGKALGTGLANAFISLVEWAINKAIDGINKTSDLLNAAIPFGDPVGKIDHANLGRVGSSSGGGSGAYQNGGGIGLASGGIVPGPRGAGDVVPAMLTPGEVVLNRAQQARVGVGRIMGVLASTGGRIGFGRFATGGVAATSGALAFARRQLGEEYKWGAGHYFGDSNGWDCSGFATNVAARVPGYKGGISTTMGLWGRMRRAKGDEPVVFGMLGMNQSDPARQHMGIRVNGQWFEAAGGGRGVIRGRSSWPSGLWIPPGLEYLSSLGGNPSPGDAPTKLSPAIQRALRGTGGFAGVPSGMPESVTRAASAAATAAGRRVLASGGSADAAREAMDDAGREAEARWVNGEIARTRRERSAVRKAIAVTRRRLRNAMRERNPQLVAALKKRLKELASLDAGLGGWLVELGAKDLELDLATQDDQAEGGSSPSGLSLSDQFITAAFGRGDLGGGASTAWQAAGGTVNINVQSLTPSDPSTLNVLLQTITRAFNQGGSVASPAVTVGV